VAVRGQDKAGLALSTIGMKPINGLRHPVTVGTTGWYIWCGETLSDTSDFFRPLCVDHLVERLPAVADLLGLPPGHRFLVTEEFLDVWFDQKLISE
jgi:hypothetical protein